MKPASIIASRAQKQLTVRWDDGHTCVYTSSVLRVGYLCAECRDGHENMSDIPSPNTYSADLPDSLATRLVNIIPVGSNAVSPIREDGYDNGIFRWVYPWASYHCTQCRKNNNGGRRAATTPSHIKWT